MALIDICDVVYRYPEEGDTVLDGVSFSVDAGEKIVLLGGNGCGKSTLLKILNGLIFPNSGTYHYQHHAITRAALDKTQFSRCFRREVVFLFQHPDAMLFNPTVYDEIAFGPRQAGLDDIDARVRHWAAALGLSRHLDAPPFRLSGGEKQKIGLAALLVLEPQVLLLDEPTANLDPRTTAWLIDFLQKLPMTHIITTHHLSLAAALGERTLVLAEHHRLIYDGSIEYLLQNEGLMIAGNLIAPKGKLLF
jgi:cobalt/nickel transport system ATP-binding protein